MDTYLKLKEDSSTKNLGDISLNRLPTYSSARRTQSASILSDHKSNEVISAPSSQNSGNSSRVSGQ